ncbi:MAG: DUF885 domain-containing protein [Gammaproteobacteria bacterium]|jgi:uncharacterized protein (DUF885 family)|nr:DUF885 domain-containing protein [Gammaproteobacteria bacterium]MBT5204180.1 DUF885 domain-containing protein [Gammaproteobacteria bacterium]MBT6246722.1 DUF885 domain-containing protein [Gammaproteobacteria bacterium]
MKIFLLCLLAAVFLKIPVIFAEVRVQDTETARLQLIFDAAWDKDMRDNPVWASSLGDRRFNRSWRDDSETARRLRLRRYQNTLGSLTEIEIEKLTHQGRIDLELFRRQLQTRIEASNFRTDLMPMSQRGGIQTLNETATSLRLQTINDYEDWLARLSKVNQLVDQTIQRMQQGLLRGYVPPSVTMQRIPNQIQKQLVEVATDSPFYQPFKNLPETISAADQRRLQQAAQEIIEASILPAYRQFYEFFTKTYLPNCSADIAAASLPDGKAFYEFKVRNFTTTSLTPDEVHRIGLNEVARIRERMLGLKKEIGFLGTLPEFFTFLRNDPSFYFDNADDLMTAYQATAKRIDPTLLKLFTKLPRMPYGIKAIPDAIAADTTTAYYMKPAADGSRPGYYYVNLYQPLSRPKFEIEVLTVHEAVPGHHLQIALQQELDNLPNFRRFSGFTVFTEGWGLYSEQLGYDLGLYKDPYSRFGQLSYDMWRAVRLVVDTGMHYKGWSRSQAIAYFKDNAPRKELDIINEIDRYISWPGQALAYKLGQLKIQDLRTKAETELGDQFDIRLFHDKVLENGAIPLDILEQQINQWITQMK